MDEKPSLNQSESNLDLKESNKIEENFSENLEQKKSDSGSSIKDKILDAIRNIVVVLMRKRNGRGRIIVWLLLICNFVFVGCEYGNY